MSADVTRGIYAKKVKCVKSVNEYVARLAQIDPFDEFCQIEKIVNEGKSVDWEKKGNKQGSRCLDARRAKLKGSNVYCNATELKADCCVAKIPSFENVPEMEAFWELVVAKFPNLHLVISEDEFKNLGNFFKQVPDTINSEESYLRVGGTLIDTKSMTVHDENIIYYKIELVPEGCCTPSFANVYVHKPWDPSHAQANLMSMWKSALMVLEPSLNKSITTSSMMLASARGSGRNCTLLALVQAMRALIDGTVPNLKQIVTEMRQARPGAVETWQQYVSVYLAVNSYLMTQTPLESAEANQEMFRKMANFGDRMLMGARDMVAKGKW